MKLAIIGGRNFTNFGLLAEVLEQYKNKITLVISGAAQGADSLGEKWAIQNNIQTLIFPANWEKLGKRAGFIRNHDIIMNCDICVAFWDGKSSGTKHSLSLCKEYKKPTKIVIYE